MNKYIKSYLVGFFSLFFMNFLLQGILLRQWNDSHLQGIRNPNFNPLILVINYLIQMAGFLYFLVKLEKANKSKSAALLGALYGGLLFINLGLSNYYLIPNYPLAMVISDTLATMVAFAVSGWVIGWVNRNKTA